MPKNMDMSAARFSVNMDDSCSDSENLSEPYNMINIAQKDLRKWVVKHNFDLLKQIAVSDHSFAVFITPLSAA